VPDLYQGTEFWDQSLVDPDNRRPVDFAAREAGLSAPPDLSLAAWQTGHIKQAIIARLLACRNAHPGLFGGGGYTALEIGGEHASHALGFARQHAGTTMIVVISRLATGLLGDAAIPLIPPAQWGDTTADFSAFGSGPWHDVLTDRQVEGMSMLSTLLEILPVAVLVSHSEG
jgi:(1->4)-alpha-D-glucan 1-alpha-D-glucosylmutase